MCVPRGCLNIGSDISIDIVQMREPWGRYTYFWRRIFEPWTFLAVDLPESITYEMELWNDFTNREYVTYSVFVFSTTRKLSIVPNFQNRSYQKAGEERLLQSQTIFLFCFTRWTRTKNVPFFSFSNSLNYELFDPTFRLRPSMFNAFLGCTQFLLPLAWRRWILNYLSFFSRDTRARLSVLFCVYFITIRAIRRNSNKSSYDLIQYYCQWLTIRENYNNCLHYLKLSVNVHWKMETNILISIRTNEKKLIVDNDVLNKARSIKIKM